MSYFGGTYTGPREVHYMFIDGEQLRTTAEAVGMDWFGKAIEIDYRALQGNCQKVFYYDCLPAKSAAADEIQYQARRQAKLDFFNRLRMMSGWHVGEGIARHRKKERQEQKEVDILIAVDMLTHTHRKNMHRLTFLTGDQDFAPLVEAVVRDGMYVELLYPQGHTSIDLRNFADVARPMDIDFFMQVATPKFRRENSLPTRHGSSDPAPYGCVHIGQGIANDAPFAAIWRNPANGSVIITRLELDEGSNNYWHVTADNKDLALRYFGNWMERDFGVPASLVAWEFF